MLSLLLPCPHLFASTDSHGAKESFDGENPNLAYLGVFIILSYIQLCARSKVREAFMPTGQLIVEF